MLPHVRLALACSLACAAGAPAVRVGAQAPDAPPTAVVDVVVLDASGRPLLDLAAGDFLVNVDGQPREVRGSRYVFRGAGAEESARGTATVEPAGAEPSRPVLIAIDETSVRRGGEKDVNAAVWRVADALTPADFVGLVLLPRPTADVSLSQDREPLRAALRRLAGRAEPREDPRSPFGLPERGEEEQAAGAVRQPEGEPQEAPVRDRRPTLRDAEEETPQARRDDPLRALAALVGGWTMTEGAKVVVFVSGGEERRTPEQRGPDPADGLAELVDAAAGARAVVHVVHVATADRPRPGDRLNRLAASTGGTLTTVGSKRTDMSALTASLAGGYVLEIERRAGDADARAANLRVSTNRKGARVIAASRWVPRSDAAPAPVAAIAPGAVEVVGAPAPPRRAGRGAAPDPELEAVMARVGQYTDTYLREFGNVIAEESYVQVSRNARLGPVQRRSKADLLLLRSPTGWIPFRDVFEVDGKPLRDRDERLKQLFLDDPEHAMEQGRRISEEGARYNLGGVFRTINTPLVASTFFQAGLQRNFRFERRGTATIDGTRVWRIGFREVGSPTQISQGRTGADLPSKGQLWAEPASGRVLRTQLEAGDEHVHVTVVVDFGANDALGVWVPLKMRETYTQPRVNRALIDAVATYARFRRFEVSTLENVGPAK